MLHRYKPAILVLGLLLLPLTTAAQTPLYVDADAGAAGDGTAWSSAYATLQDALGEANAGTGAYEIWVAAGTYYPDEGSGIVDNKRDTSFTITRDAVRIYGGFVGNESALGQRDVTANETILSGNIGGLADSTDNSYHVLYLDGTTAAGPITSATVLDGVTVTAGNADGSVPNNSGGGLYCDGSTSGECSPLLRRVTFVENAAGFGGAVDAVGVGGTASPTITDATFVRNTATVHGGALYNGGSNGTASPTITNSTFDGNTSTFGGGAIYNQGPSGTVRPTLTNVSFRGNTSNYGGAIYNASSSPVIIGATFTGNAANFSGGAIHNDGDQGATRPVLTNVTMTGNTAAESGGAVSSVSGSTPTLTNTILVGNTAAGTGSAIYNDGSTTTLRRTLLDGGAGSSASANGGATEYLNASGTVTSLDSSTHIVADPRFANGSDPDGADDVFGTADDGLRLERGSPGVDIGATGALPDGVTADRAGNDREQGANVDLGAYETADAASTIYVDADATGGAHDGTSWTDAFTHLQDAIRVAGANDEIWIAAGTYAPDEGVGIADAKRDTSFTITRDGVEIYGGFDGTETARDQRTPTDGRTILSGYVGDSPDGQFAIYNYHVVVVDGSGRGPITPSTVIDGVVVTRGYANGGTDGRKEGGGLYCDGRTVECSPTLRNVVFRDNYAENEGGALYNNGRGGTSSPRLLDVAFVNNRSEFGGGAVYNDGVAGESSPRLVSCTFVGNRSRGGNGGALYNQAYRRSEAPGISSPLIANTVFYDNRAGGPDGGGAVFNQGGDLLSSDAGGTVEPRIVNSILWGNAAPSGSGPQMYNVDARPTVAFSIVQEGVNGIAKKSGDTSDLTFAGSSLSADPVFADSTAPSGPDRLYGTADDGLRTEYPGPTTNAGNASALLPGATTDATGAPRVQHGEVDIGPYEGLLLSGEAVRATDGRFEDRVEIRWPRLDAVSSAFSMIVYRDTIPNGTIDSGRARLDVASSVDSVYVDASGDPATTYEYCLVPDDGQRTTGPYCDTGFREIDPPVDVRATDRSLAGRTRVAWADRSQVDNGFRITRDGGPIVQTDPSRQAYIDTARTAGTVAVDYYEEYDISGLSFFDGDSLATTATGVTDGFQAVATPEEQDVAVRYTSRLRVAEAGEHTFALRTNDASRLLVNGTEVVANSGTGMRETGLIDLSAGRHTVTVEAVRTGRPPLLELAWEGPSFATRRVQPGDLSLPSSSEAAPRAAYYAYYEGAYGTGLPPLDDQTPVATGAVGGFSPPAVRRSTGHAVRYRATLRVPVDTTYTFITTSEQSSRLLVDGQTVVPEHRGGESSGTIDLEAGSHLLEVDYVAVTGADSVTVEWSRPAVPRTEIPFTALSLNRVPHEYCVATVDPDGFTSTENCAIGTPGVTPPPTNVRASDGQYNDTVFLSWQGPPEADGFRLQRAEVGTATTTILGTTPAGATSYSDTSAAAGVEYRYCVSTLTPNGLFSRPSCDDGIRARLLSPRPLAATDGVHDDRIELTWDDRSPAEDAYHVYRRKRSAASTSFAVENAVHGVSVEIFATPLLSVGEFEGGSVDTVGVQEGFTVPPVEEPVAVRYRAALDVPEAGTYTLGVAAERARLLVDGTEVLRANLDTARAFVQLEAGLQALTLEYVQATATSAPAVVWEGPSFGEQALGPDALYPDLGAPLAQLPASRTGYTDTAAEPGPEYLYHVVAVADSGGLSQPAAAVGQRATVLPPETVTATDSTYEDRVELTWVTNSTRASIHRIGRDGERLQTLPAAQTTFTDAQPIADSSHVYCVEAVTPEGIVSTEVCDNGSRHLQAPTALAASNGTEEDVVRLAWTDNSQVEDSTYLMRDGRLLTVLPDNRTEYTDGTAIPGTQHAYSVYVTGGGPGRSDTTADRGERLFASPEDLTATNGAFEQRIELTWTDASQAESGYAVYRRDVGAADSTRLAILDANSTDFVDSSVTIDVGVEQEYIVEPFDPLGASSPVRTRGSTALLPPRSVRAQGYTDEVVLSWDDASGVEAGYRLLRDDTVLDTVGVNVTAYTDSTAFPQTTYEYCVQTVSTATQTARRCAAAGTAREQSLVSTTAAQARSVHAADLDGDGDHDVLSASFGDNKIAWYENTGNGSFSAQKVITTSASQATSVYATDLDGDGDRDVLSTSYGGDVLAWYENAGDGSFSASRSISTNLDRAAQVYATDVNGDGAADVLSASWRDDKVAWYENDGTGGFSAQRVISTTASLTGAVYAADLDGDEWPDVLSVGGDIIWFKNQGDGTFSPEKVISTNATGPTDIHAADLNGDGRLDVLSASSDDPSTGKIAWYENEGGGSFRAQSVISTNHMQPRSVEAADLDADGDQDVLVASDQDNKVVWYENDGTGAFSGQKPIATEASLPVSAYAVDLGGTGRPEVLLAASGDDKVAAYFTIDAPEQVSLPAPANVQAGDGTSEDKVQVIWQDQAEGEDGYRIYRDGAEVGTVAADETRFDDTNARPGAVGRYCVAAYTSNGETERTCDYGRRPPNGAFTGRVATRAGSGVEGVNVCLAPTPGRSLQLDGTAGAVQTAAEVNLLGGDLTISFWAKRAATGTDAFVLSQGTATDNEGLRVGFLASNRFRFGFWGNALDTDSTFTSRTWHHWAVTYDRDTGTRTILRDGEPVAGDRATGEYRGRAPIEIGRSLAGGGHFQGHVDEIRVWDHVRSDSALAADRRMPLTGTEEGLLAYWPVEQGTAGALADPTDADGRRYAAFVGGAHRSEVAAPLDICARTDLEGNYKLSGVRYGGETTFDVTPTREARTFEPAFKEITLSTGNPVQNEVGFNDISSFSLSGAVQFSGTQCFVDGVEMQVDGTIKGQTDKEGRYSVAAGPGPRELTPTLGDRALEPAQRTVDVAGNQTGLNFEDATLRTLSGTVGGGSCQFPIGTVTLEITSTNQCLTKTVTTDGGYEVQLPPQVYTVTVASVENAPDGIAASDVQTFFDQQGGRRVDLTAADTTLDVTYRAPLAVQVEGLWAASQVGEQSCPSGLGAVDKSLPPVPVLNQGQSKKKGIPLAIAVAEDYGAAGLCPVDSGTVEVVDEINDEENTTQVIPIRDGGAVDTTWANTPTFTGRTVDGVDRSYQKSLTVTANAGGRTAQTTRWALVTGRRQREGTNFVTGETQPMPMHILRDPPGDASYAFLEQGETFCQSTRTAQMEFGGNTGDIQLQGGVKFDKGFGVTTTTEVLFYGGVRWQVEHERILEDRTERTCVTTTERFSTSDSPLFTGDEGDVFIGMGKNLTFAEMDVLEQAATDQCRFDRSTAIGYQQSFETLYTFSRFHIENTILPRLDATVAKPADEITDIPDRFNGDVDAFKASLQAGRDNWAKHLLLNDSLKAAAPLDENRSFDAGAEQSYSYTSTQDTTWQWGTRTTFNVDVFFGNEIKESGNGVETEFTFGGGRTVIDEGDSTRTTSTTTGYVLADDDLGDNFTVDVKEGPQFQAPVFEQRGGVSSCPWEGPFLREDGTEVPATVPRDGAILQANGASTVEGVHPNEKAVLELALTNDSQTGESRPYVLRPVHASNPDGAKMSINGAPFNGPVEYFLAPGENGTKTVTMEVERGPNRYRYDDLKVLMTPPCEYDLWLDNNPLQRQDTLSVNVRFDAPCSDITLFRPRQNWRINAATDTLDATLREFVLEGPDRPPLDAVGLEYREVDAEAWRPAFTIPRDTIEATGSALNSGGYAVTEQWVSVTDLPDGEYEFRAYTKCSNEQQKVYSAPASGIKDTKRPRVLGTPAPADQVLAFGDEVAIEFDEPIDCASVLTQGNSPTVLLTTAAGDTVATRATCTGTRVILEPRGPDGYAPYEDSTLTAEVTGAVTDRVGNGLRTDDPLSNDEEWSFQVRRRAFAWKNESAEATVDFQREGAFAETLTNGSPEPVVFDLESATYGTAWKAHPWLLPATTEGTVPGGETQSIPFTVSDTLGTGTYRDTVRANSALGAQELGVTASVQCEAPFGVPDDGAAYTMSLTARLDVPAAIGGRGLSTDSLDQVAAYVGSTLRGVAPLEAVQIGGQTVYRTFLTVRSDRKFGETVTFRLWDSSQCQSFYAEETVPFRANDAVGTPASPTTLTATQAAAQTMPLAQGWTWISVNTLTADSNAVNTALSTVVPADGDVVKGQNNFSQYSGADGRWVGSLDTMAPGRGYLVRLENEGSLVLLGDSVAVDRQIDLTAGWNWLGYLPQQPFPLDHALQTLSPTPSEGDIIKSQTAFAQYVNDQVGWLGSLETMQPGRGYFLQLSAASTLAYPTDAPTTTQVTVQAVADAETPATGAPSTDWSPYEGTPLPASLGTADGGQSGSPTDRSTPAPPSETARAMPEWTVKATRHEQSMAVIAELAVDGTRLTDPQARLGAFVDGDLRGVARPVKLPGQETYRAFLLVHGSAQDTAPVTLRLFDPETRRVHEQTRLLGGRSADAAARAKLPTSVDFVPGQPRGSVANPVLVNAGALPPDWRPETFELRGNYPNPVARATTVRYALPADEHVRIEVYDLLGRRVRTAVNEAQKAGWHEVQIDAGRLASGVYFYRMEAGTFRESRKMVVVK